MIWLTPKFLTSRLFPEWIPPRHVVLSQHHNCEVQSQTHCCVTRTEVPTKIQDLCSCIPCVFVSAMTGFANEDFDWIQPLSIALLHQTPSVLQVKPKFIHKKNRYLIFGLTSHNGLGPTVSFLLARATPPRAVHLPTKHHSVEERNSHMVRRCYVSASWGSC